MAHGFPYYNLPCILDLLHAFSPMVVAMSLIISSQKSGFGEKLSNLYPLYMYLCFLIRSANDSLQSSSLSLTTFRRRDLRQGGGKLFKIGGVGRTTKKELYCIRGEDSEGKP